METGAQHNPYRSFNFLLEVSGTLGSFLGGFSECSGLTAGGDPVDYPEGTDKQLNVRKLVGLRKYTNIMLKRGYTQDKALWDWYGNIASGLQDRRDVTITLQNEAHADVIHWYAEKAWINKIEGPSFKASGNEV